MYARYFDVYIVQLYTLNFADLYPGVHGRTRDYRGIPN